MSFSAMPPFDFVPMYYLLTPSNVCPATMVAILNCSRTPSDDCPVTMVAPGFPGDQGQVAKQLFRAIHLVLFCTSAFHTLDTPYTNHFPAEYKLCNHRYAFKGPVANMTGALITPCSDNKGSPCRSANAAAARVGAADITNGNIAAAVGSDGLVTVTNVATGEIVLQETARKVPGGVGPNSTAQYQSVFLAKAADCSGGACCLDLSNWKTSDHANVAISNCHPTNNGDNQLWALGGNQIVVKLDKKCLSVGENQIEVNACNTSDPIQHWTFTPNSPGPIMNGQLCLEATQETDGSRLTMASCATGSAGQTWTVSSSPLPSVTSASVSFASAANEKIFGFGEHQQVCFVLHLCMRVCACVYMCVYALVNSCVCM